MPSRKPKPVACRTRFGRNVAELRKSKGLTQEQAAEQLGVSARYFQSLEAGEYWPTLPKLLEMRIILGCAWDQLFASCDP